MPTTRSGESGVKNIATSAKSPEISTRRGERSRKAPPLSAQAPYRLAATATPGGTLQPFSPSSRCSHSASRARPRILLARRFLAADRSASWPTAVSASFIERGRCAAPSSVGSASAAGKIASPAFVRSSTQKPCSELCMKIPDSFTHPRAASSSSNWNCERNKRLTLDNGMCRSALGAVWNKHERHSRNLSQVTNSISLLVRSEGGFGSRPPSFTFWSERAYGTNLPRLYPRMRRWVIASCKMWHTRPKE
mmetsp:Transcript_78851/g.229002  ORF Transcript_78851/g.229002 Transcript_78851/m.229002 type:complete len:250 (-) Transcript_78851:72-821(-)